MKSMSGGEWFVFIFVGLLFCVGVYGGIRLLKMNQRERAKMQKRNEERMKKED